MRMKFYIPTVTLVTGVRRMIIPSMRMRDVNIAATLSAKHPGNVFFLAGKCTGGMSSSSQVSVLVGCLLPRR